MFTGANMLTLVITITMMLSAWRGEPLLTALLGVSVCFSLLLPLTLTLAGHAMGFGMAASIIHSLIKKAE